MFSTSGLADNTIAQLSEISMQALDVARSLLVILVVFSSLCHSIPSQPLGRYGPDVEQLSPRDCILQTSDSGNFDCDLKMPTLTQIKAKMLDPAYGGKVTKDTHVFFYSNLGDRHVCVPWAIGWLQLKGITDYYWADDAVGRECKPGPHTVLLQSSIETDD